MTDLTSDEKTVLLIANEGASMMPIGRWEEPTKSLIEKGLMKRRPHAGDPTGHFNVHITLNGRKALNAAELQDDQAYADLINTSRGVVHAQHKAAAHAEKIAADLVELTKLSSQVTGDAQIEALRKWARIILERALEILK